jgi:pseudomonalisin/xanthomonalisin
MNRLFRWGAPSALALACAIATAAPGAETWVSTETHASLAKLHGRAATAPASFRLGGTLADDAPVHVAVSLKVRDKAALDRFVADLASGRERAPLGADQSRARFSPSQARVDAVVSHLREAGFTRVQVAPNRLLVTADGSAAAARRAFNTELRAFTDNGRRGHANVSDAQVPARLADVVLAVHGLDTAVVARPHSSFEPADSVVPFGNGGKSPYIVPHQPGDFELVYNAASLPVATNATIAILSDGDLDPTLSDLKAFTALHGLPDASARVVQIGDPSSDTSHVGEYSMDSQVALSTAGGQVKEIVFYDMTQLSDDLLAEAFNQVVSDNSARAINASFGGCELLLRDSGAIATDDQIFEIGIAQGQAFMFSSGDSGAPACAPWGIPGAYASYPAASPWVLALGGTTLYTDNRTTWKDEHTWKRAGGAPSATEPIPSWQTASGVVSGTGRGVPDISFDSNRQSGAVIIVAGQTLRGGGTSLAAPIFTGFWARIQAMNGDKLGFPGMVLYGEGPANPQMFHDVVHGNNKGYTAAPGWDFASGFGSLDIAAFADFISTH